MPHKLYPDIRACSKEQPMHGYEQQTDHVGGKGNENKEDGKSLREMERTYKN